jgi:iron-sulfur cluster repair protein YtfE (RIC family)
LRNHRSDAARRLPELPPAERESLRDRVLAFLRHEFADHMAADERLLYPTVAERLGNPLAMAPMRFDHRAVRWWTGQIAAADVRDVDRLQQLLYGLHAVIRVHLTKEEELYAGAVDSAAWPAEL